MKRVLLVLAVIVMSSAAMLGSLALPALAEHDRQPADPDCDWYLNWHRSDPDEAWWEYWCWWPHSGWEFVFWTWADLPDEYKDSPPANWPWTPEDRYSPPEDENSPPEDLSWPPKDWPWSEEQ